MKNYMLLTPLIGEGNGTPLQYSCLENPKDRGAWQAVVHGVAKSRTRLSDFPFTFHFHVLEKEMATHSRFLPGESQGRGSLVGCHLWGHTESDTTDATQQQQQQQEILTHLDMTELLNNKEILKMYPETIHIMYFSNLLILSMDLVAAVQLLGCV